MAITIKADTLQALADWKAGKPVRSLELGHVHRMRDLPDAAPMIDTSKRFHNDQERAHAFVFAVIEHCQKFLFVQDPHELFLKQCSIVKEEFPELTPEERTGAESLAWKALLVGWRKAIAGHAESEYIEVQRSGVAA